MLQSLDTLIAFVVILLTASLLVTILVQMLSAAFSLRGKNLGNALALTFQSIHPEIGDTAYKLAERILGDPHMSDSTTTIKRLGGQSVPDQTGPWSWWSPFKGMHLATAIRPDEIYDLLKKISADAGEPLKADAAKLIEKLGAPHSAVVGAEGSLTAVLEIADSITNADQKKIVKDAIAAAQATFQNVAARVTADVDALTKWFDSAQERAQQWFQTHTRGLTIACGVVLAFLLQLDSVEIFKFVSTNSAGRDALVSSADKLIEKADGIVKNKGSILDSIFAEEAKAFPVLKPDPEILKSATNTTLLRDAIKGALANALPKDFDGKYTAAENAGIDAFYTGHRQQLDDLTKRVAATGFNLLPTPLGARWGHCWNGFSIHFFGMLITAALLSLGAPFWYNSLKDLMSLRPAVSKRIGAEKAAQAEDKK